MTAIRYTKISEILARRIAEQRYPVGSVMPTEKELVEEFDASRHTVRAALRQLQDLRLISRRRGSGTIVESMSPSTGFSQSLSSLDDLIQLAASTPRQLQKVQEIVADIELASELGVGPGTRWLKFTSVRAGADDMPIVWTDVYVDARYGEIRKFVKANPDRLISELIEAHYGRRIVTVEQGITACRLPSPVARMLRAETGSPGLSILRQYRDQGGTLLEVSTSFYPAGRYKFSTTLVREK
ncbi:GntR family transcriptional regulator [Paralcaligenes sp. KSB-10]|jgi:DNA-binding GntR family transcriptional regulator|uniref:GntR family transcriptional regulator n=1 Tax=Paralcaligenes sp. KSB-10 TaxID=2901142 RepID=UPI001E4C43CB|nr:GntR family transcriptional regulator [Paralcaligenes sp. KSB-10]UHL64286.1 GntR family transcriptional regulator [Paralcaligenes sp. KSB-10]